MGPLPEAWIVTPLHESNGLSRATPLKRTTPLLTDPEKTRGWQDRSRAPAKPNRRPVSPASSAQRRKVAGKACIVCAGSPCHPAHTIDRSLCPEGAEDPRAVVPLCPTHHRSYDEGHLSLLEHLEPHYRAELAFAVERFGLVSTLERLTNDRVTWKSTRQEEAA